jgi:hypothetical protein
VFEDIRSQIRSYRGNIRLSFAKECGHLFAAEQVMNRYVAVLVAVIIAALAFTCGAAASPKCHSGNAASAQSSGKPTSARQTPPAARAKIRYSIKPGESPAFSILRATFNGKTTELMGKDKRTCLQIVDQRDFDGDGYLDALVAVSSSCGGNCCPDDFFFVSARPAGRFVVAALADSWNDPVIEKWKGQWSVVVVSDNTGANLDRPLEITRRFVLRAGRAVKVEQHRRKEIDALVNMRSEDFRSEVYPKDPPADEPPPHTLEYDLDGDGRKDTISGTIWEVWGTIRWTVTFADGKQFSTEVGCRRIGVLATTTNGVHDLVCDQDSVFRWDGTKYICCGDKRRP